MKFPGASLPYLAAAIGLWLAGGAVMAGSAVIGQVLLGLGTVAALGAAFQALPGLRKDAYDLDKLRRIHELAELRDIEADMDPDADSVVCIFCGQVYPVQFPTCPHCAKKKR